jgi:hypothetical protein
VLTKYVDVVIAGQVKKIAETQIPLYTEGKINLSGWEAANSGI